MENQVKGDLKREGMKASEGITSKKRAMTGIETSEQKDEDGDMDILDDEDDMALLWDAFCDRFDESEDDELDDYMLPFGF